MKVSWKNSVCVWRDQKQSICSSLWNRLWVLLSSCNTLFALKLLLETRPSSEGDIDVHIYGFLPKNLWIPSSCLSSQAGPQIVRAGVLSLWVFFICGFSTLRNSPVPSNMLHHSQPYSHFFPYKNRKIKSYFLSSMDAFISLSFFQTEEIISEESDIGFWRRWWRRWEGAGIHFLCIRQLYLTPTRAAPLCFVLEEYLTLLLFKKSQPKPYSGKM